MSDETKPEVAEKEAQLAEIERAIEVAEISDLPDGKLVTYRYKDIIAQCRVNSENEIEGRKKGVAVHMAHRIMFDEHLRKQQAEQRTQHEQKIAARRAATNPVMLEPAPVLKKRSGCCGQKSIGLRSLIEAKMSGPVPFPVAVERFQICQACQEADSQNERLFRLIDGDAFCGVPRLRHIIRDEAKDGCGCQLGEKVRYKKAACPKGKWGFFEEKKD